MRDPNNGDNMIGIWLAEADFLHSGCDHS